MRRAILCLAWMMLMAPLPAGLSLRATIPVDCPCERSDVGCRITKCSGIGSGTGTGSTGTSSLGVDRPDLKRERPDAGSSGSVSPASPKAIR